MRVDNAPEALVESACSVLARRAAAAGEVQCVYLDCGTRMVRLLCHSPQFMRHVERQMTCALRDSAPAYDATLVIWQDRAASEIGTALLRELDPAAYREQRLLRFTNPAAAKKAAQEQVLLYNEDAVRFWPLLDLNSKDRSLSAWDRATNTYYYAVEDLEPEEFIKRGHIFVQLLFRICNVPGSSLAHGAVIGLENTGVLFCAFGYRGKSTLCIQALMDGFDYVSDDYFILGREAASPLRAWPIYSIVALSPAAYDAMYAQFNGKFLSNNGRKDKYMFNIAAYHGQFRRAYPIKLAMFPNICGCAEPAIVEGGRELAIEELCFSTLNNTGNLRDASTIGKMYDFVKDLPFYRFDLSRNLTKNTACLRAFLEKITKEHPHGDLCAE